jgi:membrane-associated phospholipid phosphatase
MLAPLTFVVSQIRFGDVVLAAALVLLGCALVSVALRLRLRGEQPRLARLTQFSWQLGALLSLEQAYEVTRARIPHETDQAFMNAYRVLDLEWRYGFFIEERLERFFLHYQLVMNAVYAIYSLGHLFVTVGVLALIYVRHRDRYPFVRGLLMATTGITLIVYYLYPTVPPRLLPNYGFVDPLIVHHFVAAGEEQLDSYLYNPYAAMPSLHVGYALVVAWALLLAYRSRVVRALAVLYPVAMTASVIITGNHWVLDVLGAVLTVSAAGLLTWAGGKATRRLRRLAVKLVSSRRHAVGLLP